MADVIQFKCPSCGATLRLPLGMAARQGPCPCCAREIVAPDPYRGVGAYEPAPPPAPRQVEPFRPFADSPPLVPKTPVVDAPPESVIPQPPEAEPPKPETPEPEPPVPAPTAAVVLPTCQRTTSAQRAVLVLSILLTAVLSLIAGYIVGIRSDWLVLRAPLPAMNSPKLESPAPAVQTVIVKPPAPDTVKLPVPQPKPEPDTKPEPVKASVVAEIALKAFLDAPDWTTRSAYVLNPDKVRTAMEAYSHKVPDGPTAYQSVSVQNSYTDKKTGNTLFIFEVITEQHPTGIPVAVAETASGWQVDWEGFIEFRDDLFKAFAEGPANQTGRFHLLVSTPPPPRAANTENEHFSSFLLDPPFPGRQQIAYVRKTEAIHAELTAATAGGRVFFPVLEIEKNNTPDGKTYLEIVKILATDWLPSDK